MAATRPNGAPGETRDVVHETAPGAAGNRSRKTRIPPNPSMNSDWTGTRERFNQWDASRERPVSGLSGRPVDLTAAEVAYLFRSLPATRTAAGPGAAALDLHESTVRSRARAITGHKVAQALRGAP
jgi:hypothetical protein